MTHRYKYKGYGVMPFTLIFAFLLSSCSRQIYLTEVRPGAIRIDKTALAVDPSISAMIAPYKLRLDSTMNKIIGINEFELVKEKPNSSMGNWFADILFEQALGVNQNIDFAIQNYGGLRIPSLPKGNITVGKIYELMPFDNTLYILRLPGDVTKQLLDRIADYGGWPISKNLNFSAEFGEARHITIKGVPFDITSEYIVALPDYVANGGDNCEFLTNIKGTDTGLFIRDIVIQYLEQKFLSGEKVIIDLTERIK